MSAKINAANLIKMGEPYHYVYKGTTPAMDLSASNFSYLLYYPFGLVYGTNKEPTDKTGWQEMGSSASVQWLREYQFGDKLSHVYAVCWFERTQVEAMPHYNLISVFGPDAPEVCAREHLVRPRCATTRVHLWGCFQVAPALLRVTHMHSAGDLSSVLYMTLQQDADALQAHMEKHRKAERLLLAQLRAKIHAFIESVPNKRGPALLQHLAKYAAAMYFLQHLDTAKCAISCGPDDYFWDAETQKNVQRYYALRFTVNLI